MSLSPVYSCCSEPRRLGQDAQCEPLVFCRFSPFYGRLLQELIPALTGTVSRLYISTTLPRTGEGISSNPFALQNNS